MTDWTPEEDEAFNAVEKHSNLGKQILRNIEGQPYVYTPKHAIEMFEAEWRDRLKTAIFTERNATLEEVAKEFDKMPFGDTAASFAVFVRNMKT